MVRKVGKKTSRKTKTSRSALSRKEKSQVTKIAKTVLQSGAETKYIQMFKFQCETDVASAPNYNFIQPTAVFRSNGRISMAGLSIGETLSPVASDCNVNSYYTVGQPPRFQNTSGIKPMGMNGQTGNNINGDYGYHRHLSQQLKIYTKPILSTSESTIQDNVAPLDFRVLVVRVNPNKPSKISPTIDGLDTARPALFEDQMGQPVGIDSREVKTFEYEQLKFNSSAFEKVRDIRFTLSRPYVYDNADVFINRHAPAPSSKTININFKCPKQKLRYDPTTKLPLNWNYVYYTMVFCSQKGPISGNDYSQNISWNMEALGKSAFQDDS